MLIFLGPFCGSKNTSFWKRSATFLWPVFYLSFYWVCNVFKSEQVISAVLKSQD